MDENLGKLEVTHVYQCFWFDNKVKDHFFTGSAFLGYRPDMKPGELIELSHEILQEEEFMPELTAKIESLLGEGNYVSNFWEFGPDGFSLYWWIRKKVYKEKLKLIRQWAAYEEIGKWMEVNEQMV